MIASHRTRSTLVALGLALAAAGALAQAAEKPFQPTEGMAGKDVVWVPTPPSLVEKMLDMAKVTPKDFVMDLGSGDGRNIIAAAKRGARARGVEYNPEMVELSRRAAEKEGVADRAEFVQGDMFEADISNATVLALFLLPENLDRLAPKFLELKPGTRIVLNTFGITGWTADETGRAEDDCGAWCNAMLYIVPANAAGNWRLGKGELALTQNYQMLTGTLTAGGTATPVKGRLRGDRITFTAGGKTYTGQVSGNTMKGVAKGGATVAWTATRAQQ